MIKNSHIIDFLKTFAPLHLAESWDNVGLILGRTETQAKSVMTCLTLTPDVAKEAIEKSVSLIVSHHPILFRPVQQISTETSEGEMILSLVESGVAVYSPHTAFDSATNGINQFLSDLFGLNDIKVLRPKLDPQQELPASERSQPTGAGRFGTLPETISLNDMVQKMKASFTLDYLQYIGDPQQKISRMGIACGAAAEFMDEALSNDCDLFLTGEARFHDCLKARTMGIAMVLIGHYASERLAVEELASIISKEFPAIDVWASKTESDPLKWG